MDASITVAIVAGVAAIIAAIIAAREAWAARRSNHTERLEEKLRKSDADRHLLYLWNRQLTDHIYKGLGPPPPGPPPGLFD